jgi:hypothetical protein
MVRPTACVLTAACFMLAGCTADSGHPVLLPTRTPGPSTLSVTLDCANGIGTDLRAKDLQVVLGVVALPASPKAAALGTGRLGVPGQQRLFAKSALVVRAGASFELLSAQTSPRSLAFSWNPHSDTPRPTRALVVGRCRSTSNTRWLAFIGGYYIDRASCATVIVKTTTGQRRVSIGVGAPCVGQQPPEDPSQQ